MSHLFESGFTVRTASWHGLEDVLTDWPGSWSEARILAGLNWEPVKVPMFGFCGVDADGNVTYDPTKAVAGDYAEEKEFARIVRSDNGFTLAPATDTYTVINNSDVGTILEAVLEQSNVKFDTAGSLDHGRMVYSTVYLDEPFQIPGDSSQTFPFMAFTSRHDGTASAKVQYTTVRVVCANTFSFAEAESARSGTFFSFQHTANWRDRLTEARLAVQGVRDETAKVVEVLSGLALLPVTAKQRAMFVQLFIPTPPGDVISDRVAKNIDMARTKMFELFESPTCAEIKDTAYGCVTAASEFCDHLRNYKTQGTYMGRQLLKTEPLKARAIELVHEVINQ